MPNPLVPLPTLPSDGFARRTSSWAAVRPDQVVAVRPYAYAKPDEVQCRVELAWGAAPVESTLPAAQVIARLWPEPITERSDLGDGRCTNHPSTCMIPGCDHTAEPQRTKDIEQWRAELIAEWGPTYGEPNR